jgi:hypothetical protein
MLWIVQIAIEDDSHLNNPQRQPQGHEQDPHKIIVCQSHDVDDNDDHRRHDDASVSVQQ